MTAENASSNKLSTNRRAASAAAAEWNIASLPVMSLLSLIAWEKDNVDREMPRGAATSCTVVTLRLSHQQLASRIGAVREVVSRSLSKLEKSGVIQITGRTTGTKGTTVLIQDVKALRDYVERYDFY